MPQSPYAAKIQSVTELTRSIRGLLETQFSFVTVTGEISNMRRPYSGHLYFTLKDTDAQIRVVLFKNQQKYLSAPLQDGQQVICRGRISVYEPRGEYQIIADFVENQGTGTLQIAFDRLKKRLDAEGFFDAGRKKELPFLPEKIFLVTSPSGAALFDFLRIAESRFPGVPIVIFPVRVQGDGAAAEISRAITRLNKHEKSGVIVLCRGGGSLEDLWAFNEEQVAYAINASQLPVVSAVGHEVDFTIADFVADHRSPTPTAAAKDVLPDGFALQQHIAALQARMTKGMVRKNETMRQKVKTEQHRLGDPASRINHCRLILDNCQLTMTHSLSGILNSYRQQVNVLAGKIESHNPTHTLNRYRERLNELEKKLALLIQVSHDRKKQKFAKTAALLDAVSPLSVLARGYSITKNRETGKIIRSASQVKEGDLLHTKLHQGQITSLVTKND